MLDAGLDRFCDALHILHIRFSQPEETSGYTDLCPFVALAARFSCCPYKKD